MKMKKYTLLGLLVLMSVGIAAQENQRSPNVDEMHERKWQFMVDQAQLTPQESDAVKPVFMEYEKTCWRQHDKNRTFFRSAKNREGNATPKYAEMNERYVQSELIQAQLFKNYHLKLRKILPPERLFRYYKAERDFKRKLLQGMQGRFQHDGRR